MTYRSKQKIPIRDLSIIEAIFFEQSNSQTTAVLEALLGQNSWEAKPTRGPGCSLLRQTRATLLRFLFRFMAARLDLRSSLKWHSAGRSVLSWRNWDIKQRVLQAPEHAQIKSNMYTNLQELKPLQSRIIQSKSHIFDNVCFYSLTSRKSCRYPFFSLNVILKKLHVLW